MHDTIVERGGRTTHSACTTCIIQCSNVYNDKDKNLLTSGLEYETVWANGANCGIDDPEAIAEVSYLCDDYGLDTIEVGDAIAVAMAGGVKQFGDAEGAIELVHEMGKGTDLGRILGNECSVTGQAFGVSRIPAVKRQGLPAYDPRPCMGIGGSHDPLKPDGQVELSRNFQIATAASDGADSIAGVRPSGRGIRNCGNYFGALSVMTTSHLWIGDMSLNRLRQ
jgi:aldehyde:ferredoxin oxidoreductase